MQTCVLATMNSGKVKEFEAFDLPLQLQAMSNWTHKQACEDGQSFIENAIIKARYAATISHLPALADDSGLMVHALGGQPGVNSARYAGQDRDFDANNILLLNRLSDVSSRQACFICVLVYVQSADDPLPLTAIGQWHGKIAHQPVGEHGFGYDPIFIPEGFDITAAEMHPEQKESLSHRAKAVSKLKALLSVGPYAQYVV